MRTTRILLTIALLAISTIVSPPMWAFPADHFTPHSKLAGGRWVKVKVTQSGIHAITAADARSWGFTDFSRVRVYGMGGAPLSEHLTADIPDDLPQVPTVRTADKLLFYAQGPTTWNYSVREEISLPVQHPYANEGYYFVSDSGDDDDAVIPTSTVAVPTGEAVTTFTERLYHEQEIDNPGQTGRLFLGENFMNNASQTFRFSLTDRVAGSNVRAYTRFATKVTSGRSKLAFKWNGNPLEDDFASASTNGEDHYLATLSSKTFDMGSATNLDYTITFTAGGTCRLARLDYIAVAYERQLTMNGSQLLINFPYCEASTPYRLNGRGATEAVIWDVTRPWAPVALQTTADGSDGLRFALATDQPAEIVAFLPNGTFTSPEYVDEVANQDLHGADTPDMIIISSRPLLAQAQRLADMHTRVDSMRVLVVDQQLVYNEFSSGTPDAMAYRMLCKRFYDAGTDSAGHRLRYLLLMGSGSYDNRLLTTTMRSFDYPATLMWESENSHNESSSYNSDDPLVVLGDNSGPEFHRSAMSIAVGRLPAKSVAEARTMVNKIIAYCETPDYGAWKGHVLDVADDEDSAIHMQQADNVIATAQATGGSDMMFNRVFIDAFEATSRGGGRFYPEARSRMFNRLKEGVVWWNYTGHASSTGWTADGLLGHTDIQENLFYNHLPVLYAATCDFARFDGATISGAEYMLTNTRGGAVGIVCPTRLVYIPNNGRLNVEVARHIFERDSVGLPQRLGEIVRLGKNATPSDANNSRYFVLADPAMRLALPHYKVRLSAINGDAINADNKPVLKARQSVDFEGVVCNNNGEPLQDFNGSLVATLYDSEQSVITHAYGDGAEYTFTERPNKLALCIDKVENGQFKLHVTIPSEIVATYDNYSPSLLTMYAYDETTRREALGSNSDFYIYGYDSEAEADTIGPDIRLLGLNSEEFNNGSDVNESPLVMATIADASGVNFSQGGIGHSMVLTLDGTTTYSNLTSYYTPQMSEQGTLGTLAFPLSELDAGHHTLRLKVWDVFNNSSSREISFNVITGLRPSLADIKATPNPARDETTFTITHDRPDAVLNITVSVYNLLGHQVWSTTQAGMSNGFQSFPITWDLTDNSGRRVPRGIYVYRATISSDGVHEASKAKRIAVTGD